jgi:hypothetical protein
MDVIMHDRLTAFQEIADHLASRGRRRTVFLSSLAADRDKYDMLVRRLVKRDLDPAKQIAVDLKGTFRSPPEDGLRMLKKQMNGEVSYDTVICTHDASAMAVMYWLRKKAFVFPRMLRLLDLTIRSLLHFSFHRWQALSGKSGKSGKLRTKSYKCCFPGWKIPSYRHDVSASK